MLVLTRKSNQSIMIGDNIEVSVLAIMGEKVRIGIQADRTVPVFRKEVYLEIQAEQAAGGVPGRGRLGPSRTAGLRSTPRCAASASPSSPRGPSDRRGDPDRRPGRRTFVQFGWPASQGDGPGVSQGRPLMPALLLVAASLGMSNFAAAVAIGLSGVDRSLRLRIAFAFGLFEAAMPVVGLLLGRRLSGTLGAHAAVVGGSVLAAVGASSRSSRRSDATDREPAALAGAGLGRLLVLGAVLSIDNLVVGFALGAYGSPLGLSIVLIAVVSVGLSLIGLELGARLGSRIEHISELLGGLVLVCVGAAIATGLL